MKQQEAKILWDKYKAGKASPEEEQLVRNWFHSLHAEDSFDLDPAEMEQLHADMLQRMHQEIYAAPMQVKFWPRIAAASTAWKIAAAVAAITLGVWLYYASSISGSSSRPALSSRVSRDLNDIAPGRNTATLTLASGKVINLDTNKTSVVVTDSVKTFVMLTASTPRGGTYQVTLPDGTRVWLNADSKISFPSQFLGTTRKIQLTGEAYLEVAKDKSHPFVVETVGQSIEVLGTHFNVNAYEDEKSIKTTLIEGSVKVMAEKMIQVIRPGEQATTNGGDKISVAKVDTERITDWKDDDFIFNGDDLPTAMRKIARWYDVEIIYADDLPKNIRPGGWISRNNNLSAVLKMIEASGLIHFKIEGRRILVTK